MHVPGQAVGRGPGPGLAQRPGDTQEEAAFRPPCASLCCAGALVMPGCCHVFYLTLTLGGVCYMLTMTPVLWIK